MLVLTDNLFNVILLVIIHFDAQSVPRVASVSPFRLALASF